MPARAIGVPPRAINEIVHGKRAITPIMSLRFAAFFSQSDAREKKKLVKDINPARELAGI